MEKIVIGNGWAALCCTSLLLSQGHEVIWCTGSKTKSYPFVSYLDSALSNQCSQKIIQFFNLPFDLSMEPLAWLEFRSKAWRPFPIEDEMTFREFSWMQVISESPKLNLLRFEQELRAKLRTEIPRLKIQDEAVPTALSSVKILKEQGKKIYELEWSTGHITRGEEVYFADRTSSLAGVQGLPRSAFTSFFQKTKPMGLLQLVFDHSKDAMQLFPTGAQNFLVSLSKGTDSQVERRMWGYLKGAQSIWTLFLTPEESTDNQEIGKKLKKMVSQLEKTQILKEGTFSQQVLFEEEIAFAPESAVFFCHEDGQWKDSLKRSLKGFPGIFLLSDGYGPCWSMAQAFSLLEGFSNV